MKEKVVLAYSGGLDTTAVIPWLKETFGYDVICCCINCGQGEELDGLEENTKCRENRENVRNNHTNTICNMYKY